MVYFQIKRKTLYSRSLKFSLYLILNIVYTNKYRMKIGPSILSLYSKAFFLRYERARFVSRKGSFNQKAQAVVQLTPQTVSEPQALADMERHYRGFTHYNQQRLHILRQLIARERSELFDFIPVLFHLNHYRVPGFVPELGGNLGVYGLKINDRLRSLRKNFIHRHQSTSLGLSRQPMIESIASIGSVGTLAQTDKSDCDLWIVCRDDISNYEYNLIETKAELIKKWLIEQDPELDINFYLASPQRVRKHSFGEVSDDSAGSALGKLLKEEFYRTCVIWSGKIPLWWCLPEHLRAPELYDQWRTILFNSASPWREDIMDMGPLERSSLIQFLSAVLWQTNKSLASPFKSLLKLSLVSRYADEPETDFLAEYVRNQVQQNPTHGRSTDPYLCLFEFCSHYWGKQKDREAVTLMGEMFYLKMLGDDGSSTSTLVKDDETVFRKRREVRDLLSEWGLNREHLRHIANISNWDFREGLGYRIRTQSFVRRIFDRILVKLQSLGVGFEGGKAFALQEEVDQTALKLLSQFSNISHKVDCFYSRTPHKVDSIPPGFRKMLYQRNYTFTYSPKAQRSQRWVLTQEILSEEEMQELEQYSSSEASKKDSETSITQASDSPQKENLLVHNSSLLNLIAWLAANRLATKRSGFRIVHAGNKRPVSEARRLLGRLSELFDHPLYQGTLEESVFTQAPKIFKAFVSFDFVSHSHFRSPKGTTTSHPRLESLSQKSENTLEKHRIHSVELGEQNTYGVIKTHSLPTSRYSLKQLFLRLLKNFACYSEQEVRKNVVFHSADSPYQQEFSQDFEALFFRAIRCFSKSPARKGFALRFISRFEKGYIVITRKNIDDFQIFEFSSMRDLIPFLEKSLRIPTQTIVDPSIEGPERLREMYQRWIPGEVQIFFRRGSEHSSIHVIDEAGCLYHDRLESKQLEQERSSLLTFLSQLPTRSLRFAYKKTSQLKTNIWEMAGPSSKEDGFRYSFFPVNFKQTLMFIQKNISFLRLQLTGSLNFRGEHTLSLDSQAGNQSFLLEGEEALEQMAGIVRKTLQEQRLEDFSITHFEYTPSSQEQNSNFFQSSQYLRLRRAVNRNLRRFIQLDFGVPLEKLPMPRKLAIPTMQLKKKKP